MICPNCGHEFEEQLELGHDHELARRSDPSTSSAAAADVRSREGSTSEVRKGTHRFRILQVYYGYGPKTADEVQFITGIDGAWKRVSDLKNMGYLVPTGQERTSRRGKAQEVLMITTAGAMAFRRIAYSDAA